MVTAMKRTGAFLFKIKMFQAGVTFHSATKMA
jgi:hypothetical protein